MDAEKLFKALADESRLKIVSSLIESPKFVEQLALQLNLSAATVSFHLKKLQSAGVVRTEKQQYYQVYRINEDLMTYSLSALVPRTKDPPDGFDKTVVEECFINGRVKKLPVQVKKRQAIYKAVAERFAPGKGYTVGEVNVTIAEAVDEFIVARDEMLTLGILTRDGDRIFVGKR
ncbi:MAG: metalloregulator ArsR/SmtB family transcription factor [Clostridia bacterium]|nr:metalloregulator ArsR/SmtB family transcription factor [Clostridia bacterium]